MLIFDKIIGCEKKGHKPCMIYGDDCLTYNELIKEIKVKSRQLAYKYNKGEILIIKNTNPMKQIINLLSASLAGLVSILVAHDFPNELLTDIITLTGSVDIIDDTFQLDNNERSITKIEDNDIFLGVLSSGTTGKHKIIWRDHMSWTSAFPIQSEVFNLNAEDRLFLCGSVHYSANLNSTLHMLNEGGTIIFSDSVYPKTWIHEIISKNVSSIFMVPSHYKILLKVLKTEIHSVKSLLCAGDKIDDQTISSLKTLFPGASLNEYYGASELGHISYNNYNGSYKQGSVGQKFPGVKLWIENDEIWVESPYIAPDFRTRATVGDMGRIDKDGYLFLLGRKNETINTGGIKVLPINIESILNKHPFVDDSIIIGINHPIKGKKIIAFIKPNNKQIKVSEINKYCRQKLQKGSRPDTVIFIDKIPLNKSGKVNKKKLIEENIE